jgi:hypothetical protein
MKGGSTILVQKRVCIMLEHTLPKFARLFSRWRDQDAMEVTPDPDYHRSTAPDARMNLLLRFDTTLGPRTIVASGIPLTMASEITATMIRSGQYAEFIDQCQPLTVAERVKRRKLEKARKPAPAIAKQTNVVGWDSRGKLVLKGLEAAQRDSRLALS